MPIRLSHFFTCKLPKLQGERSLSDIPRIAFKSMAIIVQVRRRCNGFPSVAIRQSRFDDLAVVGSPFDQFCRHPDTPFPSISPRRRFPRPTPERVFVVRSSIKPKIFWNNSLGTATSANWNVDVPAMADHFRTDLHQLLP